MMPYYKVISIALRDIALNLSSDYYKIVSPQVDIGLKSNVTIIKAMYFTAIIQSLNYRGKLKEDIDIYEVLDRLNVLENSYERINAYSWIAYDCQVMRNQVNDSKVYSDLMSYLKKKVDDEWISNSEDDTFLRSILKNFSGPIEGAHSSDIFEILELLIRENKISQQNMTNYMRQVLLVKMKNHMDGSKSIYMDVDINFTYDSIIYSFIISPKIIDVLVSDIMKISKQAKRKLMKLFTRSRSYQEWKNSIEVLCWCGIILHQINTNSQSESDYLNDELNDIKQKLIPHIEDFNDNHGLLHKFRAENNWLA